MAEISAVIETLDPQLMRAWARGDEKEMKSLVSRTFMMLIAGERSMMLDRTSWLDAAPERFRLHAYRMSDVYVRKLGGAVLFAARVEMETKLAGQDWSGEFWMVDLWQKSKVRRRWTLVERSLARPDSDKDAPKSIRSLQAWR